MNNIRHGLLALLIGGCSGVLLAQDAPIMGKLGYPVGTELTIEGTFIGGKNRWVKVAKVNGKDLPSPVTISTRYLTEVSHTPPNSHCLFKGVEITYVIKPVLDPKTGKEMQQAGGGRRFDFEVKAILSTEREKTRADASLGTPQS